MTAGVYLPTRPYGLVARRAEGTTVRRSDRWEGMDRRSSVLTYLVRLSLSGSGPGPLETSSNWYGGSDRGAFSDSPILPAGGKWRVWSCVELSRYAKMPPD